MNNNIKTEIEDAIERFEMDQMFIKATSSSGDYKTPKHIAIAIQCMKRIVKELPDQEEGVGGDA